MPDLPATDEAPELKIARALLEGFDRHYRLFSETNRAAKQRFERADWHGQQQATRERIEFYDQRVRETKNRLQTEFAQAQVQALTDQAKDLAESAAKAAAESAKNPFGGERQ